MFVIFIIRPTQEFIINASTDELIETTWAIF